MNRSGSIHHDGEWWHPTPDGNWLKWDALSNSWVPSGGPPQEALGSVGPPESELTGGDYAGFWRRAAALLIDALILGVAQVPVIIAISIALGDTGDTARDIESLQPVTNAINLAIGWLYFGLFESSVRQATLGKQALGIRVTDISGNRISFSRASARYFAKLVSAVIFMIGFIMAAFTSKKQALHDLIADCLVVNGRPEDFPSGPPA